MVLEISNRGSRTQPRVFNRSVTQPRLLKTEGSQSRTGRLEQPGLAVSNKSFQGVSTNNRGASIKGIVSIKAGLKRRGGS